MFQIRKKLRVMISHSLFKLLKIYARKQPGTEVYYYMTQSTRINAGHRLPIFVCNT